MIEIYTYRAMPLGAGVDKEREEDHRNKIQGRRYNHTYMCNTQNYTPLSFEIMRDHLTYSAQ